MHFDKPPAHIRLSMLRGGFLVRLVFSSLKSNFGGASAAGSVLRLAQNSLIHFQFLWWGSEFREDREIREIREQGLINP